MTLRNRKDVSCWLVRDSAKRNELNRVGVRVINAKTGKLKCKACDSTWFLKLDRDSYIHRRDWICRSECKAHFQNISRPRREPYPVAAALEEIDRRVSTTIKQVDLIAQRVDLAIRHGDGHWAGLDAVPLCKEDLCRFAALNSYLVAIVSGTRLTSGRK